MNLSLNFKLAIHFNVCVSIAEILYSMREVPSFSQKRSHMVICANSDFGKLITQFQALILYVKLSPRY